jgi:hypothetical protein
MHPTLGILARFQAFFYALSFSQSDGIPPPAPARVTQTVGRFIEIKEGSHMGAVEMNRGGGFWHQGAYISTIEKCVYCDKCGSFKIKKLPTIRTLLWIAIAAFISILASMSGNTNPVFVGVLCFLFLLWLLSAVEVFTVRYICLKCGNSDIALSNVLNYPKNDKSIVDTPYQSAVKIYVASDAE